VTKPAKAFLKIPLIPSLVEKARMRYQK